MWLALCPLTVDQHGIQRHGHVSAMRQGLYVPEK
jgi:hypothetical protein